MTGRTRQRFSTPTGPALRFSLLALALVLVAPVGTAREVRLTLLHTAEVRGHVQPLRYREWSHHHGGLLRCASLVERVRGEEENVLLLDSGGLIHGSPESYLSMGLLPLKAASLMHYDARVPSSGDVALGVLSPEDAGRLAPIPLVAADLASTKDLSPCAAYRRCRIGGLFVAVVGLTAGVAHDDLSATLAAFDAAMMKVRADRPHITVLLAHLSHTSGGNQDTSVLPRVMARYPDLDVVIGGGSGSAVRSAQIGSTLYTEAGCEARWLGRVDLVYDTVRNELLSREADLLEVGPKVPVHAPLKEAVGPSLGRIERALDREVGQAHRRLRPTSSTPGQSDVQELIGLALAEESGAEVVLVGTTGLGGLSAGPIRWRDIIRAVPAQQGLLVVSIPGVEVRRVLEENMAHLGQASFLGIHGAGYEWVEEAGGAGEVRNLVLSDQTRPHGRRRLRVAFNPDQLEPGTTGRDALRDVARDPGSRLERMPVDVRSLVAAYVETHGTEKVRQSPGFSVRNE